MSKQETRCPGGNNMHRKRLDAQEGTKCAGRDKMHRKIQYAQEDTTCPGRYNMPRKIQHAQEDTTCPGRYNMPRKIQYAQEELRAQEETAYPIEDNFLHFTYIRTPSTNRTMYNLFLWNKKIRMFHFKFTD